MRMGGGFFISVTGKRGRTGREEENRKRTGREEELDLQSLEMKFEIKSARTRSRRAQPRLSCFLPWIR
jgi:hypothetical protein